MTLTARPVRPTGGVSYWQWPTLRAMRTNGVLIKPGVGERIRERREQLGLDQADLATASVSHGQISRIEAELRTPSMAALIDIAARLKTTPLELMTGTLDEPCPICGRGAKKRRR